jgi:CubicO group peptidase (beta-lactamase class C family)
VKRTQYQAIIRSSVFCILTLLLRPFLVHPAMAAAPSTTLDVMKIDAFVREQVQRHGIPGLSLGIVEGNQIAYLGGYGTADQTGRAVTPQTPFLLASVSKPITALAIMQLVEADKVELDAPIQRYMPDFRVADPVASQQITVRHLLQHTSGIPVTSCDTRADATTLAQFVAELRTVPLDAPPGMRHNYCSGNYNLLGRIIELVSGQPFADYIQQQVFAPLQMRHSFAAELPARRDGLAQGHRWLFGQPLPANERYNTSQLPSGYLISSAEDMTHFLIAQLNGGRFGTTSVLLPQGIAAMQAPGVPVGPGAGTYGLGWKTQTLGGVPVIQHYGDNFYYHALAFIEPQTRRGAVLLMNGFGIVPVASAFKQIEEGVAQLLAGQQPAGASSVSLGWLYLSIDAVLGGLLALALWPILRMRRWEQRLRQQHSPGWLRRLRVGLRLGWELGMPVMLLLGVRLLFGANLGAQSWEELWLAFPDFTVWLWAIALVMLLSGAIRLAVLLRIRRDAGGKQALASFLARAR